MREGIDNLFRLSNNNTFFAKIDFVYFGKVDIIDKIAFSKMLLYSALKSNLSKYCDEQKYNLKTHLKMFMFLDEFFV